MIPFLEQSGKGQTTGREDASAVDRGEVGEVGEGSPAAGLEGHSREMGSSTGPYANYALILKTSKNLLPGYTDTEHA